MKQIQQRNIIGTMCSPVINLCRTYGNNINYVVRYDYDGNIKYYTAKMDILKITGLEKKDNNKFTIKLQDKNSKQLYTYEAHTDNDSKIGDIIVTIGGYRKGNYYIPKGYYKVANICEELLSEITEMKELDQEYVINNFTKVKNTDRLYIQLKV